MQRNPRRLSSPVLHYSSLAEERKREKDLEYDRRLCKRQLGYSFFEIDWRMALFKLAIFALLVLFRFLVFG